MNALERLHKSSITATDIASQYWCEKQMELYKLSKAKKATAEIKKGKAIHEMMENEVNVPIELTPNSYGDSLFKTLYTTYKSLESLGETDRAREIQVYGSLNGFKLVGKIDEIRILKGQAVIIEDKTRSSDRVPGEAELITHKVQVMTYKKMLDDIHTGNYTSEDFKNVYGISRLKLTDDFLKQLSSIGLEDNQKSFSYLSDRLFELYRKVNTGSSLYLRYINQFTKEEIKVLKFQYSSSEISKMLDFSLRYWKGDRDALPVPYEEKWKCNHCMFFGNECKVWWPQRKLGE